MNAPACSLIRWIHSVLPCGLRIWRKVWRKCSENTSISITYALLLCYIHVTTVQINLEQSRRKKSYSRRSCEVKDVVHTLELTQITMSLRQLVNGARRIVELSPLLHCRSDALPLSITGHALPPAFTQTLSHSPVRNTIHDQRVVISSKILQITFIHVTQLL